MQFQLAEMATDLEAARLMVYNAARMKDAGQNFVKEAAMAKLFSSRAAERITSKAIELVRRLWLCQGLSGRKVLARFEDRRDLRGHFEHAVADDCEVDHRGTYKKKRYLKNELRSVNVKGEICLYGGAVMALAYNARPDTEDVDAVFEPVRHIRTAAGRVAERHGLEVGWLNYAVKMFLVPHEKRILLDLSHLKVYVPSAEYMLAMKTLSARANTMDRDDLVVLIKDLKLKSPEAVFSIVKGYYPHKEIKPAARSLVKELFD